MSRRFALAVAIAVACGPVADDPPLDVPVNACPDNPCSLYRPYQSGGASADCKQGICQVSAKIDFTLVVTPPDTSYYAPGTTFVLPAAHLFDHPSDKCPSGQCTQLPGLGIIQGDYLIDPQVSKVQVKYYIGDQGVVLPVRVAYRAAAGTTPVDASLLGLPVDTIFGASIDIPGAASGPLGGPSVGFRAVLSPGRYERTVSPEPPFDAFFPPDVSVVTVQAGLAGFETDELKALDEHVNFGVPKVVLTRDDGGSLDGWIAYTRDTKTLRRLSNGAVLGDTNRTKSSPPTYTVQLNMNHHRADALTNVELVVEPPARSGATPMLLNGLLDTILVNKAAPPVLRYPALFAPATVRGFVASAVENAPVPADLVFVSTKIYVSTGSDQNTDLRYRATAEAVAVSDGAPARYSVALPRGEYQVIVSPRDPAYAKRVLPQPLIVDKVNDPQDGKNLTVTRKRIVRGFALVSDGRPLAHAEVTAVPAAALFAPATPPATSLSPEQAPRPAQTQTDSVGAFSLQLDPGSYDITVKPAQGSKLPWVVSPSRVITDNDVTLDPVLIPAPVSAGLTLLDPSSPPNPIVGAIVRAFAVPTGGTAFVEIGRGITDAKGRYEMFLAGTPH